MGGMNAVELIDAFGGTSAVAALCNVRPPSVSGWKEAGRIPDGKLIRLAPIAEARGIATRREIFPDDWLAIWPELAVLKPNTPETPAIRAKEAIKTVAQGVTHG